MSRLAAATADARVVFVVGKGGVGKTTAAGALALSFCDVGAATHLISTDPAHSLDDLLPDPGCAAGLTLESFDATGHAQRWTEHALPAIAQLVEAGTYLDSADIAGFSRLALPGVDELMAVLRLVDLAEGPADRIVVDTAPTGHTLRLLDAAATHAAMASALRAMADKAAAVAGQLARRPVRLAGERIIDELHDYVRRFAELRKDAACVVATVADDVVTAETTRLISALRDRDMRVAATVCRPAHGSAACASAGTQLFAPAMTPPRGCDALRAWTDALADTPPPAIGQAAAEPARAGAPPDAWLRELPPLLLFCGKGGVGKSSCAAATAVALAADGPVLLCSTDPAGSLDDILPAPPAGLRTKQIDPAAELERLRTEYREDVEAAFDRIGIAGAAALDRRVLEALWELTPPGLDELIALGELLELADADERTIIDAAPTGHFLRLLAMPDTALEWVRQLMRLLVRYGMAGTAAESAESLIRLSRRLRALHTLLRDPARTAAIIVTLDEPMVAAETDRLRHALHDAGVPVAGTIVNRAVEAPPGTQCSIVAPVFPAPVGADALREWVAHWNIVQ